MTETDNPQQMKIGSEIFNFIQNHYIDRLYDYGSPTIMYEEAYEDYEKRLKALWD